MSWQAKVLNQLLKGSVKPPLSVIPISDTTMRIGRSVAHLVSHLVLVPKFVSINHTTLGHISAEWVVGGSNICDEKVILYCHGGAFFAGSPRTHRSVTWRLSRSSGMRVLAIDYRLFPEYSIADALIDSIASYEWLLEQGYKANNIVIAGDSAGGNLALLTVQEIRNRKMPPPAGIVCLSPLGDFSEGSASLVSNAKADAYIPAGRVRALFRTLMLRNKLDPYSPKVSPVFSDFSLFPPLFIQASSTELILDDSKMIAEKVREAGGEVILNVWKDMPHVFALFGGLLPETDLAIRDISVFIRQQTAMDDQTIRRNDSGKYDKEMEHTDVAATPYLNA